MDCDDADAAITRVLSRPVISTTGLRRPVADEFPDADGDDLPDCMDEDSDDDGLPDAYEEEVGQTRKTARMQALTRTGMDALHSRSSRPGPIPLSTRAPVCPAHTCLLMAAS